MLTQCHTVLDRAKLCYWELFTRTHLHEQFLENQILEAIKLWLEPLPDGSLPSLDIQTEMLDILAKVRKHPNWLVVNRYSLTLLINLNLVTYSNGQLERKRHWSRYVLLYQVSSYRTESQTVSRSTGCKVESTNFATKCRLPRKENADERVSGRRSVTLFLHFDTNKRFY